MPNVTYPVTEGQPGQLTDINAIWGSLLGQTPENVRAYGAAGDGVTDDTTAISAAIAAAGATGTVFLPPGVYVVSSLIWAGVARIVGSGMSRTTLKASGAGIPLTLGDGVGIYNGGYLADFLIDGNGTANYGLYLRDLVAQLTLERVRVESCLGSPGIGVGNQNRNYSMTMRSCQLVNSKINLQLIKAAQNFYATGTRIYQTGALTEARHNVEIGDGTTQLTDVKFEGCDVEHGGATGFPVTNFLINGANVNVRDTYMESGGDAGSHDFEFAANATVYSSLRLDGVRTLGNFQATNWMVLPNDSTTYVNVHADGLKIQGYTGSLVTNLRNTKKYVSINAASPGANTTSTSGTSFVSNMTALKAADQNFANATLADVTDLAVNVDINSTYQFDAVVFYDGTLANEIQIAFTVPTGATLLWGGIGPATAATTNNATSVSFWTTAGVGSSLPFGGLHTAGGARIRTHVRISGTVTTGSTNHGQLVMRAAKNANTDTTSPVDDSLIYAGSCLRAVRIA